MSNLNLKKLEKSIRYINSWLEINFADSKFPGIQVAILHGDKIVYSKALGFADLDNKIKLTTDNVFRIASHSKVFTSTAIMQLFEAGKLGLDDKVSKYLDWFNSSNDSRVANVTIRQLLNHTSGIIRDGIDANYWQLLRDFPDTKELKDYISDCKLIYDSDEVFKYSNYGYGYLGLVIEATSGLAYYDYVTKHIINKLGLKSTWPDLSNEARDKLVKSYSAERFGRKIKPFIDVYTKSLASATGFCSNAEDLCRFFVAHFYGNNSLLSDYSKRYMQHGYWKSGRDESYGLGMDDIKKEGWKIGGHGGGFPGSKTNTRFDPKKQLVVSALINSEAADSSEVVWSIIDIIDTFQQARSSEKVDINRFEGRFCSFEQEVNDVVATGSKLFIVNPLGWSELSGARTLLVKDKSTLKIDKANGFSSVGEDIKYMFNKKGKVKSISCAGYKMLAYDEAKKSGWID